MKAMILAAGAGSRLTPLTDQTPKALVAFQGVPFLEIILKRLFTAGFLDVVINVHHFAEQIEHYIQNRPDDGMNITLSVEQDQLLDTGGGIKQATRLLGTDPVLFHNVDILTDLDLRAFYDAHCLSGSQLSLAVKDRDTSRSLLFTPNGLLAGWNYPERRLKLISRHSKGGYMEKAFSGIYIIHPNLFARFPDEQVFSLTPWLLELSKTVDINAYDHSEGLWFDLGRIDHFREAEKKLSISSEGLPAVHEN